MEQEDRLKELVHYICDKCKGSGKLGATKLNKILWFADSIVYKQTGESITGSRYRKLQHGPVPVMMVSVLNELQSEGKISIDEHKYFGLLKKRFNSLKEPSEGIFSRDELDFVDLLTSAICDGHTAKSISELSHDSIWEAASMGEEIPLSAVLVADQAVLNIEDIKWASEVIERRQEESNFY